MKNLCSFVIIYVASQTFNFAYGVARLCRLARPRTRIYVNDTRMFREFIIIYDYSRDIHAHLRYVADI